MITVEQANRVLHLILNDECPSIETKWHETWGTLGSQQEAIGRGLQAFKDLLPEKTSGVLHGWIDQAVLEIILIRPIHELRKRLMDYRADQGGDTGILALDGETAIVLEISFERCDVTIREFPRVEQNDADGTPSASTELSR
ncbi:MAG: hypothetical protein QF752_04655 [Planctomycetota bacterium]|nr:hypothetical protein [Planctomycetota bacterium]